MKPVGIKNVVAANSGQVCSTFCYPVFSIPMDADYPHIHANRYGLHAERTPTESSSCPPYEVMISSGRPLSWRRNPGRWLQNIHPNKRVVAHHGMHIANKTMFLFSSQGTCIDINLAPPGVLRQQFHPVYFLAYGQRPIRNWSPKG